MLGAVSNLDQFILKSQDWAKSGTVPVFFRSSDREKPGTPGGPFAHGMIYILKWVLRSLGPFTQRTQTLIQPSRNISEPDEIFRTN